MRLLNIHSLAVENVADIKVPYVIISHRWLENELTFDDINNDVLGFRQRVQDMSWAKAQSASKLRGACKKAYDWSIAKYGNERHPEFIHHVWLDTVCINKRDPAELSESINSMYRWYKEAAVCFVYVHDYRKGGKGRFSDSSWFQRGWTLQELVAPMKNAFFDQDWKDIGDKITLGEEITKRTGVSRDILSLQTSGMRVSNASIGHRMSWYADRQTTKGEDAAYCLMGLFGVNMPALYGEGGLRAFRRLQEEILKYSDDHTLFAWVDTTETDDGTSSSSPGYGLLAPNPGCFRTTGAYEPYRTSRDVDIDGYSSEPYSLTNKGISIRLRMFQKEENVYVASLDCFSDPIHHVGVFLKRISERTNQYARIYPQKLCKVHEMSQGQPKRIFIRQTMDF